MNSKLTTVNPESNDPIVEELHAVRANLFQKYGGDMHAYSVAARVNAIALGFKFIASKNPKAESKET